MRVAVRSQIGDERGLAPPAAPFEVEPSGLELHASKLKPTVKVARANEARGRTRG